jgi:hypothetical protein
MILTIIFVKGCVFVYISYLIFIFNMIIDNVFLGIIMILININMSKSTINNVSVVR